ncbi:glycosyltransferase [Parahaliea maris]|uniref:Glycosyltransferase n=1 Tax=Parahaliea maris TaxID=2716870 RepID=A0A5C8ZUK8_9GAMM|nr:glycosyltransferase family 2 protein [Parahaliea maris]TXS92178.1 glycosyltransferase [Parahaliea maris]
MRAMSLPAPSLSVSLVVYQSDRQLLSATLDSLEFAVARARECGALQAPVVLTLVDNRSPENYRSQIQPLLERDSDGLVCRWQPQEENLGFGGGHNRVLRLAKSDLHLILNPDVELAADALAQALHWLADNPDTVLVAPAARGGSGEVEFLCKRYPSVLLLLARASGQRWIQRMLDKRLAHYEMRELAAATDPVEVPLVSGCCMLARTAALQSVGGFDEAFFMYFEDFDLSIRLAASGRVVFVPAMHIVHHGGYAASKGWRHIRMFGRSALIFFRRHGWRLL